MRKWVGMSVAASLFLAVASGLFLLVWDFMDADRIAQLGTGEYALVFQLSGPGHSTQAVDAAAKLACSCHGVSVMREVDRLSEGGTSRVEFYGRFNWDSFPTEQLRLSSGRLPTEDGEWLSSRQTGEPEQVGTIYEFGNNMEVTLHAGSLFSPEETDAQGVFRVVSTRPFDKDAVLDAFSLTLGVPKDELASVHTHQLRSLGGMPAALGGIAFLCLLAYLMFVGCAPVAHSKVIGVERLLGWGRLAIWLQLITPALAAQLAAAILCDVAILALVAPLSFEFLALLVALQVGLVCLSALAGLTALAVVSSIPATAAIGRAFSLRLPVGIAAVVKLAIVAAVLIWTAAMSGIFSETLATLRDLSLWERHGELYVLESSKLTSEQVRSSSVGDTSHEDKFASLYELLNDSYGGRFVSASTVTPAKCATAGVTCEGSWAQMSVNVNYLRQAALSSVDGGKIAIDEDEARRVLLVPSTMSSEQREAARAYAQWLDGTLFEAEALRWKEGGAKRSGEMLCLVYEGGKSFFSYDRRVGETSGNMVDDPVFLVLTKANITNMERSGLVRSGVGFPLKLPIGEQEATQLKGYLDSHGFAEDDIQVVTLAEAYRSQATVQAQALALVLLSITSIFALGVVSDLLVAGLMVLARRRQLSIQRMLGWGWAARHGRVLVAWVLIATAGLACMRLGGAGDVSLAIGGTALALDAAIFFILIRMYERRRVIVTERGA